MICKHIIFWFQESLEVIRNLQCEIEERNKKLIRLELSEKAQIVTQSDKKFKPRLEMTSLVSSSSNESKPSSSRSQAPDADQINVIGIYTQKNKSLENQVRNLQGELNTAKKMLASVEKYWSQQAISDKQDGNIPEDPSKSAYVVKLMKENESLKEKLSQLESGAQVCFHGKHLPPSGSCQDNVRATIEQSHANLQQRQSHIKSTVRTCFLKIYLCLY